jgi:hypothetical protein
MALAAATVLEVRTGGANTNGGGFVTGASGTDWSQQDAAQYAVTDGVTAGTTAITSATAAFGTDVVGNLVYVAGGTGSVTPGWYQITARPSTTEITVDRNTGLTAGTGVTLNIGGALASPGLAVSLMTVSGMRLWWKAGTYNVTTATPGAGGPISTPSADMIIQGYDATRGDETGTMPKLLWNTTAPGSATYMLLCGANGAQLIRNVELDGADTTNVHGYSLNSYRVVAYRSVASNFNATTMHGFNVNAGVAVACKAQVCARGFLTTNSAGYARSCFSLQCDRGYDFASPLSHCISHACTSFGFIHSNTKAHHCIADGTTAGPGFSASGASHFVDCIATNNSTYGYLNTGVMINCASFGNTTARSSGTVLDISPVLLGGDPYVGLAADDFRPNDTHGSVLRDAGVGVWGQTDGKDIGAVEYPISASGGAIASGNFRGNFQ